MPKAAAHAPEAATPCIRGCRPTYQVREAREGEGEGVRRLEGHVQRLTEQCEVESAVRCDMHALAHACRSSPSEPVFLRRVQVREDVEARLRELGPSAVQLGRRCADAEARADAAEEATRRTKARTRAAAARHVEAVSRRHEVRPPHAPTQYGCSLDPHSYSHHTCGYSLDACGCRWTCACCGPNWRTRSRRCAPRARCNPV